MGIWGSFYNIPKAIFYLLKGDHRVQVVEGPFEGTSEVVKGYESYSLKS